MSNNEVFEQIIETVSKKIINEYLTNITIVKDGIKVDNNKKRLFQYSNNLNSNIILKALNNNVDNIAMNISRHLNIKDIQSIKKILNDQINSSSFKNQLNKLSYEFSTTKKMSASELKDIYYQHIKYNLLYGDIKEKIFALATDDDFKDWLKRRWKLVTCGYIIVLLILFITYYVFIHELN